MRASVISANDLKIDIKKEYKVQNSTKIVQEKNLKKLLSTNSDN